MIKFKLASLAERPKGSTVLLPPINERLVSRQKYLSILRRMLRGISSGVRSSILPSLSNYRRFNQDYVVDSDLWFTSVDQEAEQLQQEALAAASSVFLLESQSHTESFITTTRQAIGVDLSVVVRQEDLQEYLIDQAAKNASLIKSLSDENIKSVRQIIFSAKINGTPIKEVRKALKKAFEISDKRVKLIAFDQTSSLNSDLNRIRQTQAGVDEYSWMTSADERVRSLHRSINGIEYKWNESTGAEGGLPPGQPVRCRCIARGIVKF